MEQKNIMKKLGLVIIAVLFAVKSFAGDPDGCFSYQRHTFADTRCMGACLLPEISE